MQKGKEVIAQSVRLVVNFGWKERALGEDSRLGAVLGDLDAPFAAPGGE